MSDTTMYTKDESDGWVLVASAAAGVVTIKSNSEGFWHVAVAAAAPAAAFVGEKHAGLSVKQITGLAGNVYVRVATAHDYAVTVGAAVKVKEVSAQAESINFPDILTGTGLDLGSILAGSLRSVGLPYDKLTFTKSGAVSTGTIVPDLVVDGASFTITALTAETIEVTGESNGNALGVITVSDSAGNTLPATALPVGHYFIHRG